MRSASPKCARASRSFHAPSGGRCLSRNDEKSAAMILVVHPFGNANVRAVLAALDRSDRLAKFVTTLGWSNSSPLLQALPANLRAEMMRRGYDLPHYKIRSHPFREIVRQLATKLGFRWL